MNKRPRSISVISWVFILVGCVGVVRGLLPMFQAVISRPAAGIVRNELRDAIYVCLSGLLAIVGGWYTLRGCKWARWILVVWMGFHIILSIWHSTMEVLVHGLIFAPILYLLFRPSSAAYFRDTRAAKTRDLDPDR